MEEQRLDRMEDMLTNLIFMVGNLNKQQQLMQEDLRVVKEDLQVVKEDVQVVKEDQSTMRSENNKQFSEILKKLTDFQSDQDYIWGKASRNERDIAKLKSHLQL
jgi:archaellum component FlaC